jgi:hypothetical protein
VRSERPGRHPAKEVEDTPFTREGYRSLLASALDAGYAFRSFDDPARFESERVCLLRHDIDVDLGAAVEIAEIEADLGVRSTYFVMLRSPVYNLFSRAGHRSVRRLLDLGHWLGLHYDQGFVPDARRTTTGWVDHEARILEGVFGVSVHAVSFHQPSPEVLENHFKLEGLVNTYDRDDLRGFKYISDSNMIWRESTAHEIFRGALFPRLHLLIHPLWWVSDEPGVTTMAAFDRALRANWLRAQEQMLQTERAYGPARSFRIEYP